VAAAVLSGERQRHASTSEHIQSPLHVPRSPPTPPKKSLTSTRFFAHKLFSSCNIRLYGFTTKMKYKSEKKNIFALGNVEYNESSRQPSHTCSNNGIVLSNIAQTL